MARGSWRDSDYCQTGYLRGYDLKSHADEGSIGDNTAANALRMYCTDETNYIEGPGNMWGHWLGPSYCHDGKVICGIITLVQENQGTFTDDTALNDVRFKCCDFPA
ncbi:vitelline membrane outer layer protein 1-like [Panulirus ornatus]|uniref:vitelline membrane outer layer protein 1-like n=1 Tax=Panulirus ornatus TaxID=150431 RepID=UPI003A8958EA